MASFTFEVQQMGSSNSKGTSGTNHQEAYLKSSPSRRAIVAKAILTLVLALVSSRDGWTADATDDRTVVDLLPLGTGMGATEVYQEQPSSAFVIRINGRPILLADDGLGVTYQCLKLTGTLPKVIYISHNHSDHAGELPVVLIVQETKGDPETIVAAPEVISRLKRFRLAELYSTGKNADEIAKWEPASPGKAVAIGHGLSLRAVRGKHAEISYGFLLSFHGQNILGWSSDSGFDPKLYRYLAQADHVVLDGRANGSSEHASFSQISQYQDSSSFKDLWITHYGTPKDKPDNLKSLESGRPLVLFSSNEAGTDSH